MALRTIIIDDEFNARNNLKLIIEDACPEIEIVGEADSAEKARELINIHQPELLFLDINMPGEDGFELLNSIKDKNFAVIFITAHNQFALKALKAGAVDYLEKPIDIDDLMMAVNKVVGNEESNDVIDYGLVKQLLENYKKDNTINKDTIAIPIVSGYEMIRTKDIVHLEADESYTRIFLTNGEKCTSSMTIARYERVLDKDVFFRVHKSHIINTRDHLKEFNRYEGNIVIMDNGAVIPVSRRKLTDFINTIKTF